MNKKKDQHDVSIFPIRTFGHLLLKIFSLDLSFKIDETSCASYAHGNNCIINNGEMIQHDLFMKAK